MLTVMLKCSELSFRYVDFSKKSSNMAPNCRERCWGFLSSNGFPLYLPRVTGVEIEVNYSSSFVFDPSMFCNTGDTEPAKRTVTSNPPARPLKPKVICPCECFTRCLWERLGTVPEPHKITAHIRKLTVEDNTSITNYHLL